jgi:hypothetical protein
MRIGEQINVYITQKPPAACGVDVETDPLKDVKIDPENQ